MAKRITIVDIAEECGVSITTVSRVLNNVEGSCSAETQSKIKEVIKRLNYRPNPIARSLVTKRTKLVAVLIPDICNFFFQELYKGVEAYMATKGYKILLCNTDSKDKRENAFLRELSGGTVDGVIVTTLNGNEDNSVLLELAAQKFPIVTIERYGEELTGVPQLVFDNKKGIELAVKRLYDDGHRRIAFIGGPQQAHNARQRMEGYRQALDDLDLPFDHSLVCCGDYKMESGAQCMNVLMQNAKFTAVAASNDLMAIGACKAIRAEQKSVPDDYSVVGFDGTMLAEIHQPMLTTVLLHGYDMGRKSGEILLNAIEGDGGLTQAVMFEPVIKEGNSIKTIG